MQERLYFIASILIFIVDGYLWHKLIYNMCVFRFDKKYRVIPPIIWVLTYLARYILINVTGISSLNIILSIFTILIGFILTFLFYKDKLVKSLIWNIIHLMLMAASELCTLLILRVGTGLPVEQMLSKTSGYYIGVVISKFLMFLIITLITMKQGQYNVIVKKGLAEIITLGVIIFGIIFFAVNIIGRKDAYNMIGEWFLTALLASLFIVIVLIVRVMFHLFRVAQQEMDAKHEVQRLEMELQLFNDMDKVMTSLRSLRHDLNNHFSIINGFINAGEYEQCNKYMKEFYSELDIANSFVFVENKAVSILLNNKISKAKMKGIEIENVISLDNFTMPYKIICSLIGNILDNAIEAAEKAEDKYIQLIVKGKDGECKINCENTYAIKPVLRDGKYQTSKKDSKNHGIGLSEIQEIVKEYHGTVDIQVDDMFRISLTLKT